MDVTDSTSIRRAYSEVEAALPKCKGLWGMINNAGILGNAGPIDWLTVKDYQEALDVNLLGLIDVTVTFVPLIKRRGGGRIVNTASMLGLWTLTAITPYCVSKYVIESFSDSLRRQLKMFNISMHLIEPGFYKTNICSAQNMEKSFRHSWMQAPKEIQQDYGDHYVDSSLECLTSGTLSSFVKDATNDVTDAYLHAMLGKFPRARYLLGKDAHYFFWPVNRLLPEWLGDWVLDVTQGSKRPIPECITNGSYFKR